MFKKNLDLLKTMRLITQNVRHVLQKLDMAVLQAQRQDMAVLQAQGPDMVWHMELHMVEQLGKVLGWHKLEQARASELQPLK